MEEKDIEELLQQSADSVEMRDFSEVWKNIQGEVTSARPQRRRLPKWVAALASSAAAVALISAITLPIVLCQGEPVYFWDELNSNSVSAEEFYNDIESSEVNCVDLRRYVASSCILYQTQEGVVKGGKAQLTDSQSAPTFVMFIKFYESSVEVDNGDIVYDTSYITSNGANVEYVLKTSQPEYSYYVYDMMANYNAVNYYMEYTCFTEDVTSFLDSFFA